jgi:ankyrin repeat protein
METMVRVLWVAGAVLTVLTVVGTAAPETDLLLIEAARNRDTQKIRMLLAQKVDVNARSTDGGTALLWAVHWDDLESADLLIRAGADVNAANDYRVTPLFLACTNRNSALVERLLNAGAKSNIAVATGETPMMTCASTDSTNAVRALIAHGGDVNAMEPALKQTALMWATAEGHVDVVRVLIEHGADVRAATRHGFTALHFAARKGDLESARLLLAAGVDVNIRSKPDPTLKGRGPAFDAMRSAGSTPLLAATMRGHIQLALFLLEHGADPNVEDAGYTPLHWATSTWEGDLSNPVFGFTEPMSGISDRQAKLELVKALLARGANPNARMTRRAPGFAGGYAEPVGATPFFLATSVADVEVMRLLLAAGADPTLQTESRTSPLMAAAGVNRKLAESAVTEDQSLEAVGLLLDLGADASHVAANGENALFGPAYRGWNKLTQLLVEKGANVNTVSKAGITPWLAASGLGDRFGGVLFNTETAALLVKLGADPKLGKPCQAQGKCR